MSIQVKLHKGDFLKDKHFNILIIDEVWAKIDVLHNANSTTSMKFDPKEKMRSMMLVILYDL
jgi:hypothetical protein